MERSNIKIHPELDYNLYSNDELILAHVVCHNLYVVEKEKRNDVNICHKKITEIMKKRGLKHIYYDKLDNI